jgi:hypothetical protein
MEPKKRLLTLSSVLPTKLEEIPHAGEKEPKTAGVKRGPGSVSAQGKSMTDALTLI